MSEQPFFERHLTKEWEYSMYQMTLKVLAKSQEDDPGKAAIQLTEDLAKQEHPIFGHRSLKIIDSLVKKNRHQ